ncbi:MAG: PPK2 family polyphosphate kinase [Pseudomonadota bacterium]
MQKVWQTIESPFLAETDGSFRLADRACEVESPLSRKQARKQLDKSVDEIAQLQRKLYAQNKFSLLLVFQAMDAAGKDSTIRAVLSGVNPAGCHVTSYKKPNSHELDHDFLWRTTRNLPERGRIGVFNRSQYEEVLVVRVHPEILKHQQLPYPVDHETIWQERLQSITDQEKHLARNGTVILKFFLNVSRDEQRRRFIDRLEEPHKRWKFEANDVRERGFWDQYMHAYQEAIAASSKPWAPWFVIPADDKPNMRLAVSDIVERTLESLNLRFPVTGAADQEIHDQLYAELKAGD